MPLPHLPAHQRRWWLIGCVGVSIMVGFIVWFALAEANQIQAKTTAYKVISDAQTRVEYEVHRPDGAAVRCTVEAQDVRHGRVGVGTDEVPAGGATVRRAVMVRTSARAVTGIVTSCVRNP